MATMAAEVSNRDTGNRDRAIDLAVSQIEKQFGKGSIMKLGEDALIRDVETISTGSLGLDLALGVGGLPRGRVVEIYGPESSGKTTLALQVIAQAQRKGGICAFIDAEHALDVTYGRKLGVKTEDLLISQPDHGEQALEIAETLCAATPSTSWWSIPSRPRAAREMRGDMAIPMGSGPADAQPSGAHRNHRQIDTRVFINKISMKMG